MHVACTMSLSFYIQDWPPFLLFFIYVINCNNFNLMNIKFHSYRFWNYPICFCCFFFVFFNNVLYFIQMLNTATFHCTESWKWVIMYLCVKCIDFAPLCLYNDLILELARQRGIFCFVFHFNIILVCMHLMWSIYRHENIEMEWLI